jgi:RNA polymerase sigma-70 factor (ECF subfamily)
VIVGADRDLRPAGGEPAPDTSFEALYRSDFVAVAALAYALSGSRVGAEELAQDAFLAAHRRWSRISAYDDPGAWVRRVVVNRSVSALRRRGAEARALARLAGQRRPQPEPLAEDDEAFWRAVRALPRRQAQAMTLHYLEDRPVEVVAAILGCAPATVRVHLHRGRRALATTLRCTLEDD